MSASKANPFADSLALIAIGTIGPSPAAAPTPSRQQRRGARADDARRHPGRHRVLQLLRRPGARHEPADRRPLPRRRTDYRTPCSSPRSPAFSVRAAESRYADCARALGVATTGDDNTTAANNLVDALRELCRDVAVPTPKAYGIDKARWDELIPLMAEQALASGSPNNNPLVPTDAEIRDLYAQIYG